MNALLGEKRTFFDHKVLHEELKEGDNGMLEELKDDGEERQDDQPVPSIRVVAVDESKPKITSLDIVAWAYLKEEIVNTSASQEVKELREKYPNLVTFVGYMDRYFEEIERASAEQPDGIRKVINFERHENLVWNHSADNAQKIVSSL